MSDSAELIQRSHKVIGEQVHYLSQVVDDIIDISRIKHGNIVLNKKVIELNSVLTTAENMLKPLADAKQQRLCVELFSQPTYLYGDEIRLIQVITNILENAVHYTRLGGKVQLICHSKNNHIKISIKDNGIGITENMMQEIFTAFTQVKFGHSHVPNGLGIGLALLHKIIRLHQGDLQASSDGPGKGSTFTITLPAIPQEKITRDSGEKTQKNHIDSPKHSTAKTPTQHSKRILIVDDNEDALTALSTVLELIGHETTIVTEGFSAIDKACQLKPDIILLDIGLPGLNGYDICRNLRQRNEFQHTLIIAQTGWGEKKDIELAQAAGFDNHLTKPVSIEKLKQLIG